MKKDLIFNTQVRYRLYLSELADWFTEWPTLCKCPEKSFSSVNLYGRMMLYQSDSSINWSALISISVSAKTVSWFDSAQKYLYSTYFPDGVS